MPIDDGETLSLKPVKIVPNTLRNDKSAAPLNTISFDVSSSQITDPQPDFANNGDFADNGDFAS
jgi:hypothetical protein